MELLNIRPKSKCLDVASGLGDDVARLGLHGAEAHGVDLSSLLIEEARRRWTQGNLFFHVGNAEALPFPDDHFQAVRIDRSLQHVADAHAVVAEMTRVTERGGRVLCAEPDWGTFIVGTEFDTLTQEIQAYWSKSIRNPWIGRNLPQIMRSCGIENPTLECQMLLTEGFEDSDRVFDLTATVSKLPFGTSISKERWLEQFRKSEAIAGVLLFMCCGTKN